MGMTTNRARTKLLALSGLLATSVTGCQSGGYHPFQATQAVIGSFLMSDCGVRTIKISRIDDPPQPEADHEDTSRDSTQTAPQSSTNP